MFKARAPPKGRRKQAEDDGAEVEGAASEDARDETAQKLAELRMIQKEHWQKPRGVLPNPSQVQKEEEEEEEVEEKWGLDSGFAATTGKQGPDEHLEKYINDRLYEKKPEEEEKKERTREERLYDIPEELQVKDFTEGAADKMSWVAGLAEVPLGVEYKLANIEATEKAKRDFIHGEVGSKKAPVIDSDAVTRKAIGSRFIEHHDRMSDSKSATDDAVLERFRKRMRK
mmetsp:Transcript_136049/g.303049  ORF Transcript_136049/g.303049 Transcript_136049/m.303049 type:complete len:228 (-) Transcript_136049:87-770(-)